jgi:cellulose synthase/poly-beta-1,6-N-acetylglucosamine synthase-like glycosyltransferase
VRGDEPGAFDHNAADPEDPLKISVITTLYNEAADVEAVIRSVLEQTHPPHEVVVTDAGSTDGTVEILDHIAAEHPTLRVIHQPGDRTVGRNTAIAATTADHLACIDGGCIAEPDWLEHIADAFADGADWVAGFYRPEGRTLLSTCIGLVMVYTIDEVDPDAFIPSARSLGFSKEAWEKAGGFPVAFVAEDSAYGEALRAAGYTARFAPEAVVRWRPPAGLASLWVTVYRWGRGDGLTGMRNYELKHLAKVWGATGLAVALSAIFLPPLIPVALVPLAVKTVLSTQPKYRHARGVLKFVYLPIAYLVASAAEATGFVVGAATAKMRPDPDRWRSTSA